MPYRFFEVIFMSKKTKRKFLRKVEKAKQIKSTHSGRKLSNRDIKQMEDLDAALVKYLKKDKKYYSAKNRHQQKKDFLQKNLIDVNRLKYKEIEMLKMDDLYCNRFNLKNYPQYKNFSTCDMYRVMKLNPGTRLYVAYQDYTGENTFEYILSEFKKYQPHELLQILKDIVNRPLTGVKGMAGTSSGQAGTAIWSIAPNNILIDEYVRVSAVNRHLNSKKGRMSRIKIHDAPNKGYQRLQFSNGKATTDRLSAYDMLVIITSLIYNVTEGEREGLYQRFYGDVEDNALENDDNNWVKLLKLLPKPSFWG